MAWEVVSHRGSADHLHHLDLAGDRRSVHLMSIDGPAVALGSTQSDAVLSPTAVTAGCREVTRRHSGGGLVALTPREMLWVDVVVPIGDPLWRVDVGEAFVWLGRAWGTAIDEGRPPARDKATVHRGASVHADLGRVVCFAGVGSGEVMVANRKVVGMSQRRTRTYARFQCLVHARFDADETVRLLAPHLRTGPFGERLRERLDRGVGTVGDLPALLDRFLSALP